MGSFYLLRSRILLIGVGILWGALFSTISAENANTDPPPTITSVDTLLYEIIELGDALEESREVAPYAKGIGVNRRDVHILGPLPLMGF